MRILIISLVALLATTQTIAQDTHFRGTAWGMSQAEVKAIETADFVDSDKDLVLYQSTIAGMDCYILYRFTNNQLSSAIYSLNEKHSNDNEYLNDLGKLKNLLDKKYGKAISEKVDWKNDLYKEDKDKWGFAVSLGHLELKYEWGTNATTILAGANGDNYKVNVMVVYQSKSLMRIEQEAKESEILDDF